MTEKPAERGVHVWVMMVLFVFGLMAWPQGVISASYSSSVLTIGTILERASTHHPDVTNANNAVKAAERDLEAARSAFSPRMSVDGTAMQIRVRENETTIQPSTLGLSVGQSTPIGLSSSASVNFSLDGSTLRIPSWSLGLTYPLLRSSDLRSDNLNIRQAQIGLEVAKRQAVRASQTAIVDAIGRYHDALMATKRLERARDAWDEAQVNAESTADRFEMGLATEIDLMDAENSVLREQLEWTRAQRAYNESLANLAQLIGYEDTIGEWDVASWQDLPMPEIERALQPMIEQARRHDPLLWQRRVAVETAELQLRAEIERSRLEGSIGATVSRGRSQEPERDDTPVNLSVQVQFSYPIADGGARRRALLSREEALEEAINAYEAELSHVETRIRQLMHALDDAVVNTRIAELNYIKAKMELEQAQRQYSNGLMTATELRRVQTATDSAYGDWQSAILSVYTALWNLDIAAGQTPDFSILIP